MSDLKQLVKYFGWFLCLYFSLAVFPMCSAVIGGLLVGGSLNSVFISSKIYIIEIIQDGMFIAVGISLIKFKKYAPLFLQCSSVFTLITAIYYKFTYFSKNFADYPLYGDLQIASFLQSIIIPVFLFILANQIKKSCDQS